MSYYTELFRDDFNRANEEPLDPTRWTLNTSTRSPYTPGDLAIINKVAVSKASEGWNVEFVKTTIPADQYAEVTIGTFAQGAELYLRSDTSWTRYYQLTFYCDTFNQPPPNGVGSFVLNVVSVAGGTVELGYANFDSLLVGDVVRFEVIGSQIVAKHNGVVVFLVTDTTVASGQPGMSIFWDLVQTDTAITLFTAGSVSNTPPPPSNSIPFLGSVSETSDDSGGTQYFGHVKVITDPRPGAANPYLGKIKKVTVAPGGAVNDPFLGEVVIVSGPPAGFKGNDVYLGHINET